MATNRMATAESIIGTEAIIILVLVGCIAWLVAIFWLGWI